MSKSKKKVPASVVWFNVPAGDVKRAQKFYSGLFGWKIKSFHGNEKDFLHFDTGGPDASPDGGPWPAAPQMKRKRTAELHRCRIGG